jgi:Aldehyde oxidase and xanthine dehydrogenase, a/b hammerhead domain/CO dehydrogenase flavoprotein C-terminal domain/Molybdopterin-binding domain of aldehyde dehydrogenase
MATFLSRRRAAAPPCHGLNPSPPWAKRSLYLKIRDRESYEFALASAAVALDLDGSMIRNVRIALGGVSALPWRAHDAEQKLVGQKLNDATLNEAANVAFAQAKPREYNAFKVQLGKLTLMRALRGHGALEMNRAAPEPKRNMGEPVPRIDSRLKVTGEALYASDFAVRNPAYAFFVTSPIAKGRIEELDLAEALAVPGVLDILTYENTKLKELKYASGGGGGPSTSWQALGPEIGHDGQIVAVVIADTFEAAREGAHRTEISYAAEQPSATFDSPGTTQEDASKVNERAKELPEAGDAEAAVAAAEVVLDAEYGTPTQHHNPIELFTTTCVWNDDELIVYEPSQFVFGLKNNVAQKLGVAAD